MAAGPGGHLFRPGGQRYTVLELDERGEPVRRYDRRTDWFAPGDNRAPDPNRPGVSQLRVDSTARIWAIVMLPTSDYRDAFDGYGPESYSVASFDRIRDSVIEVIDPSAGRVVARGRFPQAQMRFLPGSDQLYTARQDSMGYVFLDILSPAIRG